MGQKAKNAGKKQSKTCNKPATSKSVSYTGGRAKVVKKSYVYSLIDNEGNIYHMREEKPKSNRLTNKPPAVSYISGPQKKELESNELYDYIQEF